MCSHNWDREKGELLLWDHFSGGFGGFRYLVVPNSYSPWFYHCTLSCLFQWLHENKRCLEILYEKTKKQKKKGVILSTACFSETAHFRELNILRGIGVSLSVFALAEAVSPKRYIIPTKNWTHRPSPQNKRNTKQKIEAETIQGHAPWLNLKKKKNPDQFSTMNRETP